MDFNEALGLDQQSTRNPFEDIGLSPELIKTFVELDDGEALQTAVSGVKKALVRHLHPDASGTKKTEDAYRAVIDSSDLIESLSPDDTLTYARGYVASSKKRGGRKAKAETQLAKPDFARAIFDEIISPETLLNPLSPRPGRAIIYSPIRSANPAEDRVMLFETIDGYEATKLSHIKRYEYQNRKEIWQHDGELIRPGMPWDKLFDNKTISDMNIAIAKGKDSEIAVVSGTIVRKGDSNFIFNREGILVSENLEIIDGLEYASDDGIYSFQAVITPESFKAGTARSLEVFSSAAEQVEETQTEQDLRIVGVLDRNFDKHMRNILKSYQVGEVSSIGERKEAEIAIANDKFTQEGAAIGHRIKTNLENAAYAIDHKLTRDIHEFYHPLLLNGGILVGMLNGKLTLLGRISSVLDFKDLDNPFK